MSDSSPYVSDPDSLNPASKILIITINHSNAGLFAYVMFALNQIRYCEQHGFLPVVYFGPHSFDGPNAYYDPKRGENMWDYYFEPVAGFSYGDIRALVESPHHFLDEEHLHYLTSDEQAYLHAGDPDGIYNYQYGYYTWLDEGVEAWFAEQRRKARRVVAQYIRVKPDIAAEVAAYADEHFSGRPVLGVHMRGTDKGSASRNRHIMSILPPEEYFPHIDAYVDRHPGCRVFLATDQQQFVERTRERYGDRLFVRPAIRSRSQQNPFQNPDDRNYQKGRDVLVDCLLLSRSDYLLKCASAVGEFAFYFNPELQGLDLNQQASPHRFRARHSVLENWRTFRRNFRQLAARRDITKLNLLFYVLHHNPSTRKLLDWIENQRFASSSWRRSPTFLRDYVSLLRNKQEIPWQQARERSRHAARRAGGAYYSLENASGKTYLEIRNDWDPNAAFFAQYLFVLQQIRFAEIHKLVPVVKLDYPYNFYFDVNYGKNVWENYFYPVGGLSSADLDKLPPSSIAFLAPGKQSHLFIGEGDEPPLVYNSRTRLWWRRQRCMGARLTAEYIRIRPHIVRQAEAFYQDHFAGQRVLGIHLRGTDKSVQFDGRPQSGPEMFRRIIPPEEYLPFVDRYIDRHPDCKLFVATDQAQFLSAFRQGYGDRVLSTAAERSSTSKAVFRRSGTGYPGGVEVLIDCLLLSRCDFLLKCMSNVGEVALYFNPGLRALDLMYPHDPDTVSFTESEPGAAE